MNILTILYTYFETPDTSFPTEKLFPHKEGVLVGEAKYIVAYRELINGSFGARWYSDTITIVDEMYPFIYEGEQGWGNSDGLELSVFPNRYSLGCPIGYSGYAIYWEKAK